MVRLSFRLGPASPTSDDANLAGSAARSSPGIDQLGGFTRCSSSGYGCAPNIPQRNHYRSLLKIHNIRAWFLMPTETQRLDDLHAIRRYVTETLCEKDRLEAN